MFAYEGALDENSQGEVRDAKEPQGEGKEAWSVFPSTFHGH